MNDTVPGVSVDGHVELDGERHLRARRRPGARAPARRDGLPALEPVSQVDLRERRVRPAHRRRERASASLAERVERALRHAALWDEVKDRLHESGARALGRPAAAPLHRARARRRARGALMDEPASALDPIATAKIEDLVSELRSDAHDRHRHPQHAAGRARLAATPASSTWAASSRSARRRPSSRARKSARPRTTSPGDSADRRSHRFARSHACEPRRCCSPRLASRRARGLRQDAPPPPETPPASSSSSTSATPSPRTSTGDAPAARARCSRW